MQKKMPEPLQVDMTDKPQLLVIAGPNGSGKTTFTRQLLRHYWSADCVYINPDAIAQEQFDGWNDQESVLKAANRAAEMREECLRTGTSMVLETVLSQWDKVMLLKRAQEMGFFTRLFFMATDTPEINAARVTRRVIEGGHDVPISKIISRYSRSMRMCVTAGMIADRLYLFDNSYDGADPVPLLRKHGDDFYKCYEHLPYHWWATGIFRELSDLKHLPLVSKQFTAKESISYHGAKLHYLVSRITPENRHDYADTDWGDPVGRELL